MAPEAQEARRQGPQAEGVSGIFRELLAVAVTAGVEKGDRHGSTVPLAVQTELLPWK